MLPAARMTRLDTLRRSSLVRLLAPLAAVSAIVVGLHHVPPLDSHDLGVVLAVVGASALLVALVTMLASRAARPLPVVVVLRDLRTRALARDELDFCAALHAETLPHGFFSQLGRRFLRAYLDTFRSSPHAVALVLAASGEAVGTVVGILRPRAHRRWVLRHRGLRLALLGALALAARPLLAARFARTRLSRYRRALARPADAPIQEPSSEPAVLSHLAVVPGAQGVGLGSRLVDAFVQSARAAGSPRIALVTLAGEPGAAGFYERLGWTETGRRIDFDGQPVIELTLPLR